MLAQETLRRVSHVPVSLEKMGGIDPQMTLAELN